jgi:hypothetical protein
MSASNEYHFVSHWRVKSSIEEVSDVLDNAPDLARWWPSVYLSVKQTEPRGPVELITKGRLPYTIHWFFRVTESRRPHGFSIEAWGDVEGRGTWTMEQDGPYALITYDWRIRAEKPLLRYLSFLLKPMFSANHRWAMARGEESLKVELARRAGAGQHPGAHMS